MSALAWYAGCGLATICASLVTRLWCALRNRLDGNRSGLEAPPRQGLLVRAGIGLLRAAAVAALWPLAALMLATEWCLPPPPRPEGVFTVRQADLVARLDIGEIERRERVFDPMGAAPELPFGHLHSAWQAFLAGRTPDQAIWSFEAAGTRWGEPWRRAGYVLVGGAGIGSHFLLVDRSLSPAVPLADLHYPRSS